MYPIRRILVAVKQVRGKNENLLRKSIQLARSWKSEICLFHAISDPLYIDFNGSGGGKSIAKLEQETVERTTKRLEMLATSLRNAGLVVTTRAVWDYPPHDSVIRAATRWQADMVIADCYRSSHPVPWLLRFTDWELLRHCPVPVLLVKTRQRYSRKPVLAAIDPLHESAKPAHLDDEILGYASTFAAALQAPLHAVNAYNPMPAGMTSSELFAPGGIVRAQKAAAARAHKKVDPKLQQVGVPVRRRHFVDSFPGDAIQSTVDDIGAQMVVMGAISRSGLKHLLIGNTAERMLDRLACDILIVKPRKFKARVARAVRGAQIIVPAAAIHGV